MEEQKAVSAETVGFKAESRLRLWPSIVGAASTVATCAACYSIFRVRSLEMQIGQLEKKLANLSWTERIFETVSRQDTINPDTGTIQFLRRAGLSITLTPVKYETAGLHLIGVVGNPRTIWISSATLRFEVRQPWHLLLREHENSRDSFFPFPATLGKAEAETIGLLAPSGVAKFDVTIPNVAQKADETINIEVAVTGERYFYSP